LDADSFGLRRISDLAARADRWRVGLFGEFLEREDGMKSLNEAYGFRFRTTPREMDFGLLYPALLAGEIDVAVGSATDGLIAARNLVVLEDDLHFFPPYDAVPILRTQALAEHPELAEALRSLAGRLDAVRMRRLNYEVDGEHVAPAVVARRWLGSLPTARP
jgi:glycine betaine/choline ABC-type transport system substrate-binding protein